MGKKPPMSPLCHSSQNVWIHPYLEEKKVSSTSEEEESLESKMGSLYYTRTSTSKSFYYFVPNDTYQHVYTWHIRSPVLKMTSQTLVTRNRDTLYVRTTRVCYLRPFTVRKTFNFRYLKTFSSVKCIYQSLFTVEIGGSFLMFILVKNRTWILKNMNFMECEP